MRAGYHRSNHAGCTTPQFCGKASRAATISSRKERRKEERKHKRLLKKVIKIKGRTT